MNINLDDYFNITGYKDMALYSKLLAEIQSSEGLVTLKLFRMFSSPIVIGNDFLCNVKNIEKVLVSDQMINIAAIGNNVLSSCENLRTVDAGLLERDAMYVGSSFCKLIAKGEWVVYGYVKDKNRKQICPDLETQISQRRNARTKHEKAMAKLLADIGKGK